MSSQKLKPPPQAAPDRDAEIEASRLAGLIATEVPALRRYATAWTGDFVLAEELVGAAVRRAYETRDSLAEIGRLRTWLFWWLRRVREERTETVEVAPARPRFSGRGRIEEMIGYLSPVDAPHARIMVTALAKLTPFERQVVLLVDLEGMSYREVGEVLAIPLGQVVTTLAEARETLRLRIEQATAEEEGPEP
jgi:RNA polymerase sigma-70 factor (ECF subfamily)